MVGREEAVIAAIGEILWDIFPDGKKIGGAPANFAYYLSRLGEKVALISRVGQDRLGYEALSCCREAGLTTEFIQKDEIYPTGKVRVDLDNEGLPVFEIETNAAWDFIEEDKALFPIVQRAKVIYFGTLAQRQARSRRTIQRLLDRAGTDCLKVLDLNLRPPYFDRQLIESSLKIADVVKLNLKELTVISELFSLRGTETEVFNTLIDRFSLRLLTVTEGENGSWIISPEQAYHHSGYFVPAIDTVGAGDAFTAALVHGLLSGLDLGEINKFANQLASFVCTQKGAWVNIDGWIKSSVF
ncbi:MAG: carbohydrate kinase [Candidatus Saccharicenans sp.]|nr:carbohydrate kinase [Candidatus Saccharicenans sp.]MDI6849182.1 carbohydrate kinase [Candidatus Saccharicenans sp.]